MTRFQSPFALSLSKGRFSFVSSRSEEEQGFNELSPDRFFVGGEV